MRRTERAAYRTKFYSNLSSPTRFDEEPQETRIWTLCCDPAQNYALSAGTPMVSASKRTNAAVF